MHWFDTTLAVVRKTVRRFPPGIVLAFTSVALADPTVSELRCEDLENPLGIDAAQPRLAGF